MNNKNIIYYCVSVVVIFIGCIFYSIQQDKEQTRRDIEVAKISEARKIEERKTMASFGTQKYKIRLEGMIGDDTYDECVGYIHETYLHTIPKPVPLYINQVCSCFAEKMGAYEKKSTKEELDKYKASKVYSIKIKSKNYETCMEKTTVDTRGDKKYY